MSWGAVAGAAIVAGGSYLSSKKNKSKASADNPDLGQDIMQYIQGYKKGLPSVVNLEKRYREQFQNLNLSEINSFLKGDGIDLFGLSNKSQNAASKLLSKSRDKDLKSMTGDAAATRGLLGSLSPEQAAQVKAATDQAAQLRQSAQGLSGQEQRSAEQFAREQGLDSGRIGDNTTLANSLLNRESILSQKRAEANQATSQAYDMAGNFYTQNGLNLLTQTPQSYQAGQGLLGIGLGSIGSSTPQLVNPDMGVNVGAANRQNQLAASSANAQASAANNSAWMNLLGQGYSSYLKYR